MKGEIFIFNLKIVSVETFDGYFSLNSVYLNTSRSGIYGVYDLHTGKHFPLILELFLENFLKTESTIASKEIIISSLMSRKVSTPQRWMIVDFV